MGYSARQYEQSFFMASADQAGALAAIKADVRANGQLSWTDTDTILKAKIIDQVFEELQWDVTNDEEGNITELTNQGEKLGDENRVWKAIAPFVKAGSYFVMVGEDGFMWRWYFTGQTCIEQKPKLEWPDVEEEEDDGQTDHPTA